MNNSNVGFFHLKKSFQNLGKSNSMGFEITFETVFDLIDETELNDNYHNGMVSLYFGEIEDAKKYFQDSPSDVDYQILLESIMKK
jgi:hypothetical protein